MTEEVRKITEEFIAKINRNMGNDEDEFDEELEDEEEYDEYDDYDEDDDWANNRLRMDNNINNRLYCYDELAGLVEEVTDDMKSWFEQTIEATYMLEQAFGIDGDHEREASLTDLFDRDEDNEIVRSIYAEHKGKGEPAFDILDEEFDDLLED